MNMYVCMYVCMRAWVRACVRMCVCVRAYVSASEMFGMFADLKSITFNR